MRALWLSDRTLRLVDDAREPAPKPGEALIGVSLAGICNTDLELVKGYYPFSGIPGHEFVGRVVSAPGARDWEGRRVVGEINLACGRCATCRAGRRTHCARRTVLGIRGCDGAFAERLVLPVANLHAVPDRVLDEAAVFAEPLAAALEVLEQVSVTAEQRVVVVGAGKLGALVAQVLALTGCQLTVVARGAASPPPPLRRLGVPMVSADAAPIGAADVVVDCTGTPEGFAVSRRAVRPRGTLVLKSTYRGPTPVDLAALVVDEISLIGSRCGPLGKALEVLEQGEVEVASLIEERYPLAQALAAFEHAGRPGALKLLIRP